MGRSPVPSNRSSRTARRIAIVLAIVFALTAPANAALFVRGEVNGDAQINIADAVFTLSYLFADGPVPACLKAADINDDGAVDISDAVFLLSHLFASGANPPPPFPDPGTDPTADTLSCGDLPITDFGVTPSPVNLAQVSATAQLQVSGLVGGVATDLTSSSTGTTYASSNAAVAFVYRDGLVEAKGSGNATITVRNGVAQADAAIQVTIGTPPRDYMIVAANDLGMHCIDREFSIYSILPPFNVFHAQVIKRTTGGKPQIVDDTTVAVRYSPVIDVHGSINSTSIGKTTFWTYVQQLYGAALAMGQGLLGAYMPADAPVAGPQPMPFDAAKRWFSGEGTPIIDRDDAGTLQSYPLMRVTATNKTTGAPLAHLDIVVPVSSETDCQNCHATGTLAAKDPGIIWAADADLEVQTKKNVLLLHDVKSGTSLMDQRPVLCARCHYSPALDLGGTGPQGEQLDHAFFSRVMHGYHGNLLDNQGNPVFPLSGDAATTCYQCHPGKTTKCLRGAMFNGGLECRHCHGNMLATGGEFPLLPGGSIDGTNDGQSRRPWRDLPRCQSCHTGDAVSHLTGADLVMAPDGIRLAQAYRNGDRSASPILATNKRFAESTNQLFRFSMGHGNVACEGCHGSTHAEWPHADPASNDNVAAVQLQGHTGRIIECGTCHAPGTLGRTTAGPHGMHNVNDPNWYDDGHENFYEDNPQSCRTCHGTNLEGTVLSKAAADRTFPIEDVPARVAKGAVVSCTLCHGKP